MELILADQVVISIKIKWTHVYSTIIAKREQYNMKKQDRALGLGWRGTERRPLNKIKKIFIFTYFSLQGHSCLINTWCVNEGHFANDIGQIHIFLL